MLWRQRRWRRLLSLIERLPAASHLAEAQSDDEDLARALLGKPQSEYRPRISEWSPVVAELNNVVDRLGELTATLVAVNGGKPPRVRPRPRPYTAIDRVRWQMREQQHASLVARLLPHSTGREGPV